jgi:hypothetical protein
MLRLLAITCSLFAFLLILNGVSDGAQKQKNQMVKGTIKSVDLDKSLLIINQKVKDEVVDRELSIEETTEFIVMIKGEKKQGTGAAGFKLLENAKGASVQVKCDKDVKVLQVKATVK